MMDNSAEECSRLKTLEEICEIVIKNERLRGSSCVHMQDAAPSIDFVSAGLERECSNGEGPRSSDGTFSKTGIPLTNVHSSDICIGPDRLIGDSTPLSNKNESHSNKGIFDEQDDSIETHDIVTAECVPPRTSVFTRKKSLKDKRVTFDPLCKNAPIVPERAENTSSSPDIPIHTPSALDTCPEINEGSRKENENKLVHIPQGSERDVSGTNDNHPKTKTGLSRTISVPTTLRDIVDLSKVSTIYDVAFEDNDNPSPSEEHGHKRKNAPVATSRNNTDSAIQSANQNEYDDEPITITCRRHSSDDQVDLESPAQEGIDVDDSSSDVFVESTVFEEEIPVCNKNRSSSLTFKVTRFFSRPWRLNVRVKTFLFCVSRNKYIFIF